MKKMWLVLAVTFAFGGFFSSVSQAGILMEPYLGYEMGKIKWTQPDGTSVSQDNSAANGGLRLGLRHMGLWIAADGDFSFAGKSKPSSGTSDDYTALTVSATLGYDFMNRLRIYAGAGFLDSIELKDSLGVKTTYYSGTPFKVGLGYWLFPHMCINFEYDSHDYKKVKGTGYDESISDAGFSTVKSTSYMVNFSFPYTF